MFYSISLDAKFHLFMPDILTITMYEYDFMVRCQLRSIIMTPLSSNISVYYIRNAEKDA